MSQHVFLNPFQIAVANKHSWGEFAYITEVVKDQKTFDEFLEQCGDTLFRFLMIELSSSEDCSDQSTALQRLHNAACDITDAISAIEEMEA